MNDSLRLETPNKNPTIILELSRIPLEKKKKLDPQPRSNSPSVEDLIKALI